MTKMEVRVVTLATARLAPEHLVYDIGAGTGSLAVEAALQTTQGQVWAIERQEEALDLIRANANRFEVNNLEVVSGVAPEALMPLPQVDRIFIGGSGGRLPEVIRVAATKLLPGGIIVLNAVTWDTLAQSQELLGQNGYVGLEVVCLNVARLESMGSARLFKAQNPVYIISARKE